MTRKRRDKATKVGELLERLRAIGTRVKTGAVATARDVAALERKLGFELPASYRAFLGTFGELRVADWRFYGVTGALARNKAYGKESAAGDRGEGNDDGSYTPKRFVVLSDQGDYSNAGEGWVFDADLDALMATDGARWIEREAARDVDYWDWLAEELEAVHATLAAEREQETKLERSTAAITSSANRDGGGEAERLYRAFASYEKAQRWHCFNATCKPCDVSNRAFDTKQLRKLTAKDLAHYVDKALGTDGLSSKAVRPATKVAREQAFKHFLPRCLELIGDLGSHEILRERKIFVRGFLKPSERKAVDAWLMSYWHVMLGSPATLPVNVTILLRCVPDLGPYFAAWESSTSSSAQQLRVACAEEQVLLDVRHRCARQRAGPRDPAKVPLHQRHMRALHGDIGAGAHRDADVGPRERRRVVDAITGHRHLASLRLQASDVIGLLIGQDLGEEVISPSDTVTPPTIEQGVFGQIHNGCDTPDCHGSETVGAFVAMFATTPPLGAVAPV